jgi:putative DNA primase/helicase
MASLAGKLFSDRRVPIENVLPMLQEFNRELCDPPLAETDVRLVWRSIRKKAPTIPDRIEAAALMPIRGYLEDLGHGEHACVDRYTDQWLGLEFVERHAAEVRYTAAWSRYNLWDGNRWRVDNTLKVFSMAQVMCREIAAKVKGKKASITRSYLLSGSARARALEMARENPKLAARPEDWDRDPWLLGTPAGTVDLKTGELRPSDQTDMITKSTAVSPGGDCPLWLETLEGIFLGDKAVIGFVKRLGGYSLTGLTVEEVLAFLHGSGGNGKGTFIETILHVLGDYGTTVPMTTLVQRRYQEHPTEIAKLHGKRLAVASETEEGMRWNTARIKLLTGGDVLTGRYMRNDYFDFAPTHQLFVSANDQPSFGKVDDAVRRRLAMVPFLASFQREDGSLDVTRKARLRAEGPGILRWLIEGCLEWQAGGLALPAKLKAATDAYLAEADDVARFVHECCVVGPRERSSTRELYAAFCVWSADNDIPAISQKALTERLKALGFEYKPGHANQGHFTGVRKALESDLGPM